MALIKASERFASEIKRALWVKHHNVLFASALNAEVDYWRRWPD